MLTSLLLSGPRDSNATIISFGGKLIIFFGLIFWFRAPILVCWKYKNQWFWFVTPRIIKLFIRIDRSKKFLLNFLKFIRGFMPAFDLLKEKCTLIESNRFFARVYMNEIWRIIVLFKMSSKYHQNRHFTCCFILSYGLLFLLLFINICRIQNYLFTNDTTGRRPALDYVI